jgi:hypothetical protein
MIARHKEFSKALKGFVITMLLLTIAFAALFEYANNKSVKKTRPLVLAFKEGKNLLCREKTINQKIYSYEPGTSTFQPRLNVVGDTYGINECQLHP